MRSSLPLLIGFLAATASGLAPADDPAGDGVLPADAQGRPLNFDFETGTLQDWRADGPAFEGQPIEGDTVAARRGDMKSQHAGRFWIGTFERTGDAAQGTLTSVPFVVSKPFASFLIAGGSHRETRVELVRQDSGEVISRTHGDDTENLKRVAVDLTPHLGKAIFIRLVDQHSGGWGHINFDDFRLHDTRPAVAERDVPPPFDQYAHEGLPPEAAAEAMTIPPGFHVTLFAGEPDIVQPIAMTIDDRGRLWVAEAYSYPVRVPDDQAKDRILIFEDTDNDGHFDKRKVFADKLNLVSGLELGFGGVWVGAAPYLMFIPDENHDDKPDGPPQILLDGWAMQDTHETLNSFIWGPDGWLYGCHGVFTHSNVGKPGAPDSERTRINAGVWRYHPTKHLFEVFAEGTSNPWGVDFDEHGQCFIEACVIPHLYHMVQGGRFERQAGQHFNPYTYDDIKTIADHRHYIGATPHSGNGRSDAAGGGHAHAGAMIYMGAAWPDEYRGSLFMNNIHGARLNRDILTPKGSGFVGSHAPDFLLANDLWSQVVYFRYGPDGNVIMIDWYDKNQCHRNEVEMHDRTNGRIFKISHGDPKPLKVDMQALDENTLVDQLKQPNAWYARQARRLLQERGVSDSTRQRLAEMAFGTTNGQEDSEAGAPMRLRALWTLHGAGGLSPEHVKAGLADQSPYIRAWTIQLACEDRKPSEATRATMAELARSDSSPVVRLYLASALQRLPLEQRWAILEGLLAHSEDVEDHNLPLMDWYAAEPLAAVDASRALELATGSAIPQVRAFMVRRVGAIGTPDAIALLVRQLGRASDPEARLTILTGINDALKGRRQVAMPDEWPGVFKQLLSNGNAQLRSQATALAMTFGDASALDAMREVLADPKADLALRREALAALLKVKAPRLAPALQRLLNDPELRAPALRGLASYEDEHTPEAILKIYDNLPLAEKRDALNTLASRVASARRLLAAVGAGDVPARDLTADIVRQLRSHKNSELDEQITKVWGTVRETSADRAERIAHYKADLLKDADAPADLMLGRAVFSRVCAQCHTLFGTGGKVGPELTGSNRAELDYILSNILDPSALIGKDYQAHTIATTDGRVLIGLIQAEDDNAVTLVTANETLTLPKDEIDERRLSDQSMMPEDLLQPLAWDEVRTLVAYLASPGQVPMLATPETAATFFNGRDLTGWQGDPDLWTVTDGEIVGKTSGLARNEFLRSDLAAGDFRLTLQVKLVNNEGNSGVQFRSEALPEGEMKGDQADIGAGWWGKLYEENGRGLLWDQSGEPFVKSGVWNTYEVIASGSKIQTKINGHLCVDLDDPPGARRGIFAFQLHAGGPTEVRFKDIHLELIGEGK